MADDQLNPNVEGVPEPVNEPVREPVQSPYVEPVKFDYNKLRDDTAAPAMREILKFIGESATEIVLTGEMVNKKTVDELYDKVSKKVLEILTAHNVTFSDYQYVFEYLQSIFYIVGDVVGKQRRGHEREILSRVLGAKNPGNAKFDVDYANYGDLMKAVLDTRSQTGDKPEDYFHINPNPQQ